MYFSFGQSLDELSQLKASSVVQEVDEILEYGEEANNQSLMLLEKPDSCEAHSVALRHLVATVPYVRSANLAKDNVIYCTSIWGGSHYQYDLADYSSGRLRLMHGNKVDAKHPLIVVRSESGEDTALSGIDSLHLRQLLEPHDKLHSYLAVGEQWLGSKDLVLKVNPADKLIACQEFIDIVDSKDVTLVLELTEREALNYCDLTDEIFTQIKSMGCKIAIDDFGTGHFSLVNLRKVDLDYLKINQTFVRDIGVDTITGHLLQNMITLSHDLSLDVVAEGVETEFQAEYLKERGVSYLQGFLFAKSMPLKEFLSKEFDS